MKRLKQNKVGDLVAFEDPLGEAHTVLGIISKIIKTIGEEHYKIDWCDNNSGLAFYSETQIKSMKSHLDGYRNHGCACDKCRKHKHYART